MKWLDRNEGMILKILCVIFLGFGTGLLFINEYGKAVESGAIGILLYGIHLLSLRLEKYF